MHQGSRSSLRSARKSLPCLNLYVLQLRRVQAKADAMSTTKATPSSTPFQVRPLPQPLARRMDTPFIFSTVTAFFMTACRLSFSWNELEKMSERRDEQPNNSCFSVIVELRVTNYMLAKDPSAFASLLAEGRPSINLISKSELVEQLCSRADSRFAEYMVRSVLLRFSYRAIFAQHREHYDRSRISQNQSTQLKVTLKPEQPQSVEVKRNEKASQSSKSSGKELSMYLYHETGKTWCGCQSILLSPRSKVPENQDVRTLKGKDKRWKEEKTRQTKQMTRRLWLLMLCQLPLCPIQCKFWVKWKRLQRQHDATSTPECEHRNTPRTIPLKITCYEL